VWWQSHRQTKIEVLFYKPSVRTVSINKINIIKNLLRSKKMANIKSAKKRIKVTKAKALQNKMRKTELKTLVKIAGNDTNAETITKAIKRIDQATAHGLMHKNTASRKKSQLMKKLNTVA
jgi:small subunit ribosomal protein S20